MAGEADPRQSHARAPIPGLAAVMRDRDNQNHFGFDDVDHAERKASEDYAASPQKIWTSVLREGGEARHRFFHCLDEVVTEARGTAS